MQTKTQNAEPRVSVIIVNWNGKHHLKLCLPALLNQTYPPHELIVVDNNSTDESLAYLTQLDGLRVVVLDANLGFAGGNAAGYDVATGDYIVLLNNDTKPNRDWLEQLIRCASSDDNVGIVGSVMTDWEGKFIDTAGDGCTVTGRGLKLNSGRPTSEPLENALTFSACAGAALYKRTMLDDVGFLDTHFFMNGEDTDLAFRAQLRGWKVALCSRAIVRHRIGASQGVYSEHSVYFSSRNHTWLFAKCMPAGLVAKYLPLLMVHWLSSFIFFTFKGRGRAYALGSLHALRELPRVLEDRRRVQASRTVGVEQIESNLVQLHELLRLKLRGQTKRT